MLVLSGYVKDDLGRVYQDIPRHKKYLITMKKNITPEKLVILEEIFQEVIQVDDYYESSQVETTAIELFKRVKFSRIITPATGEFDLIRAAQLREYLGLEGQNITSALAFRDKIIMKDEIAAVGLKTPFYAKVNSCIDLYQFIDTHGYPVIVKPRRGVASLNTRILHNAEDLKEFLTSPAGTFEKPRMMVESFVKGGMFHVDGLVIKDKLISWPSTYLATAMDMVQGQYFANHLLSSDNPLTPMLKDYAEKVLKALPTPENTAFHLELFQNEDGELIFCEVASRAGGGYTNSIWDDAFGIPLRDLFYYIQAGLELPPINENLLPKSIPASVVIPKKTGIISKIQSECSLGYVTKYVTFYKEGDQTEKSMDTMNPVLSGFMTGISEQDTRHKVEGFLEWVNQTVTYQHP